MEIGFENINPTPTFPATVNKDMLSGLDWDSRANAVIDFKNHLKDELRKVQVGRCCYCRRFLGDPMDTNLEHFMEKIIHTALTFEIQNIGLSCTRCNTIKQRTCSRLWSALSRLEFFRSKEKKSIRSSSVVASLQPLVALPDLSKYRWVHPHFHSYSEHLSLSKAWVFAPLSKEGRRTINGLDLNGIEMLERRKLEERSASEGGRLARLVAILGEVSDDRAKELSDAIAAAVRRRMKSKS